MSIEANISNRHKLAAARAALWCGRGLNLRGETLIALTQFFENSFSEGDLETTPQLDYRPEFSEAGHS